MATSNISFDKDRGIKGCMADAWKIVALNWKTYFMALLPWTIFAGMAQAFLVEMCKQYICQHAVPAYLLWQQGAPHELAKAVSLPVWHEALYLVLALFVALVATLGFVARVFKLIRCYKAQGRIDGRGSFMLDKSDRQTLKRLFQSVVIFAVALLVIGAPFVYAAVKWQVWVMAVYALIVLYLLSAFAIFTLRYALYMVPFKSGMCYALKRTFGLTFNLMLLAAIPVGLCAVVLLMPVLVYVCTSVAAVKSQLMGDAFGLPSFVTVLFFVLNTIGMAASLLVSTYSVWALGLKVNVAK